jgi:hypothetical protein
VLDAVRLIAPIDELGRQVASPWLTPDRMERPARPGFERL